MSSPRRKKSDDLKEAKQQANTNLGKMRRTEDAASAMSSSASSMFEGAQARAAQAKKEYEESTLTQMSNFFKSMVARGGSAVVKAPSSSASSSSTAPTPPASPKSPKSPARESKSSRSSTPDSFLPSSEDAAYIANVQTAITEYRRLNPNKAQTAKRTPELELQLERLMRAKKNDGDGWDVEMKQLKELVRKFSSRETFGYGHIPHASGIDTLLKKFTTVKPEIEPIEGFNQGRRR